MTCSTALVLLLDISGSINAAEWQQMRNGHAEAFRAPAITNIIQRDGLAVAAVQFDETPRTVIGWRVLRTSADAASYAATLDGMTREGAGSTWTGNAIEHALTLLDAAPCGENQVIDLVTDGPPNGGTLVTEQRDIAWERGVRINALTVRDGEDWARGAAVTRGGFVIAVDGWDAFPAAIRRKLILEVGEAR